MTNKDLMLKYIQKFRLECHYRLDMTASEYDQMPIHIYKGAHKGAFDEMMSEFELDSELQEKLNSIYDFFERIVVEKDNYNIADRLTVKAIEGGEF
ncbi:hypothetical protein EUAN_06340 [Andreesenia angusta]|uniref:Uncharacterized protein n=1 Tax=Andreesenia angusta TaxID=39480 RepID=A0A1S1V8X4_9FIRM|nr:hypothetical protein [Andreesenia angusta]OHW62850.1 hypothetical protein EUAN_06340 [Andreesenia angusta]